MIYINHFFSNIFKQFRNFYLNSNIYNKKISKSEDKDFYYKPSPDLLSSLIKYQNKKIKIEDLTINNLWNKDLNKKEFRRLHSFYWFFSLDLLSSKTETQSIILNWINSNGKYNSKSWEFDLTSKRIIAWLSCSNLTFEDSNEDYKKKFNLIIQKQTNHIINEINNSDFIDDKLIGCAAIILVGLCYKIEKKYLEYGFDIIKKISKSSLDNYGFPRSRNIKQLVLFLKYFILIREWCKEAQITVPENIDETIYYLGQGYTFMWQNINSNLLFNGNTNSNNHEFDNYLKRQGYKFKNDTNDFGGYIILKNKKTFLTMDVGSSPSTKYSGNYQAGSLSFEIIRNGRKLISNCGYYNKKKSKLNLLSKSTAAQSTLTIDDESSCKFNSISQVSKGVKILEKKFTFEKNYWKIVASHDGYLKKYNSIHEREIEFYPEQNVFLGRDKIIKKKTNNNYKFDIRFHVEPGVKLMKTQNNKTILIELEDEGWKFTCKNYDINIDNGLYFGDKNSYTENQNIFVTGVTTNKIEEIDWKIEKL